MSDEPHADGAPGSAHASPTRNTAGRLWLLGLCIAVGCVIGFIGEHYTGSSAWFLAVPAIMACGWFFVADPTTCLPPTQRSPDNRSTS